MARSKANGSQALTSSTTLLLAGHAATGALDAGYRVLIVDACGSLTARTGEAALRQLTAYGGGVTSTVTIGTALVFDFTVPLGQRMFAALR